ncbi:hypothetical protein EI94DRAFT_735791 [Lactarius quietus]|nr:hypothetical protein EI94DRAFT_735791 [Lactarius quietus]
MAAMYQIVMHPDTSQHDMPMHVWLGCADIDHRRHRSRAWCTHAGILQNIVPRCNMA